MVFVLLINDLTLQQFIDARKEYRQRKYGENCLNCCSFIHFANDVLKDEVKLAFTKNFPHMKYTSSKAVRHFMQLSVI